KYRTRGLDFVTNGHPRTRARRQIDVYPRTKANEAIALACIHFIARLGITENTFGDQAGDLDGGDHMPARRAQHHGVALVLERSLIERRVKEFTSEIFHRLHGALHRRAV